MLPYLVRSQAGYNRKPLQDFDSVRLDESYVIPKAVLEIYACLKFVLPVPSPGKGIRRCFAVLIL